MRLDRGQQVGGSAVVQKEETLAETPKRRGPKLIETSQALNNVVHQSRAHAVDQKIGIQINCLVRQRRRRKFACLKRRSMTERTANSGARKRFEQRLTASDRCRRVRGTKSCDGRRR